jgi:mannose-6-phosphate isomerase-like protein (cupin superfamily)
MDKPSTVETDRSDYIIAGVLFQPDNKGNLKPVAYFSTKMSPAEYNYEIYNKKLLVVIRAFEK